MSARCLRCGAGNEWIEGKATHRQDDDLRATVARLEGEVLSYRQREKVWNEGEALADALRWQEEARKAHAEAERFHGRPFVERDGDAVVVRVSVQGGRGAIVVRAFDELLAALDACPGARGGGG